MSRNPDFPHTRSGGPWKMNADNSDENPCQGAFRDETSIEVVVQIDDVRIAGCWNSNDRGTPAEFIGNVIALLTRVRVAMDSRDGNIDTRKAA